MLDGLDRLEHHGDGVDRQQRAENPHADAQRPDQLPGRTFLFMSGRDFRVPVADFGQLNLPVMHWRGLYELFRCAGKGLLSH
ncbi:hypothetical protein GCM10009560_53250 [Nonomuraea longicatena]|uniref:Transposase n=1 Tax=Nonomuraea longicatena TaxID=83682 RepID=A0ABP4AXF6_9ACTN